MTLRLFTLLLILQFCTCLALAYHIQRSQRLAGELKTLLPVVVCRGVGT